MKEKQSKKLTSYQSVMAVMEKNLSKVKKVKELNSSYEQFIAYSGKLIELRGEFDKEIQPDVDKKAIARESLIKIASPIANILQVYAYDTKDKGLGKKVDVSKNKLTKSKDSALIDKCETIWKTVKHLYGKSLVGPDADPKKKSTVNIASYGISGKMIDDLENSTKQFIESILNLKNSIAHKNKCGKKITDKIKEIDGILKIKIDKLMSIFEIAEAVFYKEYVMARIIEKEASEKKKKAEIVVKEETKELPANLEEVNAAIAKSKTKKTLIAE